MVKAKTLLDRTFDDGVALTLEVRNYIAYREQADRREFNLPRCLEVGYQHTRISARLIQVMTWLLALKSLLSGEISTEQFASPQYALNISEECGSDAGVDMDMLPSSLRDLMERSQLLFQRIQRLDAMVRARIEAGETPDFSMLSSGPVIASGAGTAA